MKKYIQLSLLSLAFIAFFSCSTSTEETNTDGKEYTSTYICPMHCEGSGSDSMGTCPVCSMDYVENPKN